MVALADRPYQPLGREVKEDRSPGQARSACDRSIQEVDRVASPHFSRGFDGRVDSKITLGLLH